MRNTRSLIVLLMVFVALVALLMFQNDQRSYAPTPTSALAANPVFTDFTPDGIQAVRLRSPQDGVSFVISRATDGTGSWTAPESSGTLNTAEAENIARTMVLLPYSSTLPLPQGTELAGFGFTPEGILSIEILLADGNSHVVAVGYRTPTEENYYGVVDDRQELYLLSRPAIDYLIARLKSPPTA